MAAAHAGDRNNPIDLSAHYQEAECRDAEMVETNMTSVFYNQSCLCTAILKIYKYIYMHIVSTVADSAVSVSWSLSRATLFATSHLLAITVIHVRPSSRTGQGAPLDDIIIMGGTGDRDYHTCACVVSIKRPITLFYLPTQYA